MKQLIETFISDGTSKGKCWGCEKYFKKDDIIIVFDKVKVYKVCKRKICWKCYLQLIADAVGWKKINKLIQKNAEEKI